jgi:glutamate--cysteine ligase
VTTLSSVEYFERSVRERLFAPDARDRRCIGAEIEMLALLVDSRWPCPLEPTAEEPRSTLGFLRSYGASHGWRERRSAKGSPYFALPNGWTLTFEPGGQLELCTVPTASVSDLIRETRTALHDLRAAAGGEGIILASVGIDPENPIDRVPLQLSSPRYVAMTRYFETIGPSGARMMRQTAATQLSVDGGPRPEERWRLLCDLAPYLTAIFANSPRYAGRETGDRSFRARCWRLLDASRTGIPHPECPAVDAYTRFALEAVDMTRTDATGAYRTFADWAGDDDATEAQWENHLTTLFPEVRPRGHLELRAIDAVDPELVGAALVLVAGVVYDPASTRAARELAGTADEEMLNRAAHCGLRDRVLSSGCQALVEIGLRGARALGTGVIAEAELEEATDLFARSTGQGLSPADAR